MFRLGTRYGTASYYSTFTEGLDGLIAGNFGMRQSVQAAAFELPGNKRYSFKILSLRVEELPTASQRTFIAGEGSSLGFFGTLNISPRLQITAEGARTDADTTSGTRRLAREGDAVRIGLNGVRSKLVCRAEITRTDAEFVKPGDRFSTAATPNRTVGTLSLARPVGRGNATFNLSQKLQTRSKNDSRATAMNIGYTRILRPGWMLNTAAKYAFDRGGGRSDLGMQKLDRDLLGASLTLSQLFGRISLSETMSHQPLRDAIFRAQSNDTNKVTITASGSVTPGFQLNAMTEVRRSAGDVTGNDDAITFSITPAFTIPGYGVSLQPRISWNLMRSELRRDENRSEQYAAVLQWSPEWIEKYAALQISTNWDRSHRDSASHVHSEMGGRRWAGDVPAGHERRDRTDAGDAGNESGPGQWEDAGAERGNEVGPCELS